MNGRRSLGWWVWWWLVCVAVTTVAWTLVPVLGILGLVPVTVGAVGLWFTALGLDRPAEHFPGRPGDRPAGPPPPPDYAAIEHEEWPFPDGPRAIIPVGWDPEHCDRCRRKHERDTARDERVRRSYVRVRAERDRDVARTRWWREENRRRGKERRAGTQRTKMDLIRSADTAGFPELIPINWRTNLNPQQPLTDAAYDWWLEWNRSGRVPEEVERSQVPEWIRRRADREPRRPRTIGQAALDAAGGTLDPDGRVEERRAYEQWISDHPDRRTMSGEIVRAVCPDCRQGKHASCADDPELGLVCDCEDRLCMSGRRAT